MGPKILYVVVVVDVVNSERGGISKTMMYMSFTAWGGTRGDLEPCIAYDVDIDRQSAYVISRYPHSRQRSSAQLVPSGTD